MGIMMFGFGVGAVSGTALALKLRPQRPLVLAVGVCPIVGLWILSLAVPMPIWVLFLMAMAGGIALDLMYANWMTTIQTNVPQEALSRVGSYDAFGSLAFAPLGLFFAGPLTHLVGARTALIAVGLMVFIAALLPLASSEVRHLKAVTHAEND
jgi:MFS family permease